MILKPGFHMICNGRRRSIDESQTPHMLFYRLVASTTYLVRKERQTSQFSFGSYTDTWFKRNNDMSAIATDCTSWPDKSFH